LLVFRPDRGRGPRARVDVRGAHAPARLARVLRVDVAPLHVRREREERARASVALAHERRRDGALGVQREPARGDMKGIAERGERGAVALAERAKGQHGRVHSGDIRAEGPARQRARRHVREAAWCRPVPERSHTLFRREVVFGNHGCTSISRDATPPLAFARARPLLLRGIFDRTLASGDGRFIERAHSRSRIPPPREGIVRAARARRPCRADAPPSLVGRVATSIRHPPSCIA